MFYSRYVNDLGPLYTPAVGVFASGYVEEPEPDRVPFGPSLNQSLWLVVGDGACKRSFGFGHVVGF